MPFALNTRLLELVEAHLPVPRWHGLRVVAADASKMQLFLHDVTGRMVREAIAAACSITCFQIIPVMAASH